ncbi:hypothetical protein PIB30_071291 [Stylosanthes scabra]|uniref:Uncharacterized protein n=1 Tax=Stylosanthes scabra TaxID=79078 RepID=A0ABU6ZMF0_9FABA|nr:hypothetical protein [Stylosanthes scabra]
MVSSLQQQMEAVCGLLTMMMQQINPGMSEENIAALIQAARNTPSDASSSKPRVNTPRSSESTHFPPNGDDIEFEKKALLSNHILQITELCQENARM